MRERIKKNESYISCTHRHTHSRKYTKHERPAKNTRGTVTTNCFIPLSSSPFLQCCNRSRGDVIRHLCPAPIAEQRPAGDSAPPSGSWRRSTKHGPRQTRKAHAVLSSRLRGFDSYDACSVMMPKHSGRYVKRCLFVCRVSSGMYAKKTATRS